MDSTDNFSDNSDKNAADFNDEKRQSIILGKNSNTSRSNEKSTLSRKRKYVDICENEIPQKKFCKHDIRLIVDQNLTENELKTNYSPENRVDIVSDESIYNDGTEESIHYGQRKCEVSNKAEKNLSLMSSEKNMDCTFMNENEKYSEIYNPDSTKSKTEIYSDLKLHPVTLSNDIQGIESTIQENDENILDYIDIKEPTTSQDEITNKKTMTETGENLPTSSKLNFVLTSLDECTSTKYSTFLRTLTRKESEYSDSSGFGESGICKSDMISNQQYSVETIQNSNDKITDEILEQTAGECSREICNTNVNGRKFEETEISNKTKVTEFSTNDVMSMPLDENSITKSSALSHTETFAQGNFRTDFTVEQKSTKILEQENISEQTTEANEGVLEPSKNKENSKEKSNENKNKLEILEVEALEKELIHNLFKEYLENTKMEEFTFNDIIQFITKRMPNAPFFRIIHAVRVFVVNNLKSGVLKQFGLKYSIKSKSSHIFF